MIRMNIQIIQFDVAKSQNQFQLIRREPVVDAGFPSIPLILIRLVAVSTSRVHHRHRHRTAGSHQMSLENWLQLHASGK